MAEKNDVAKRFMRAIFDANESFKKAPKADMVKIIADWSGQKDDIVEKAYERMNPTTSMTKAQAQKWWDIIGTTMVERGELSPKLKPFPDVFDLSLQPL